MALQEPQGGEVKHPVRALERRIKDVGLEDVAAGVEDTDAWIGQRARQVLRAAAHEVVVDDERPDILAEQAIRGVRPDQARATDEDKRLSLQFHSRLLDSHK